MGFTGFRSYTLILFIIVLEHYTLTLLTVVLFTEDVSRNGSRPLCFNTPTASQLTNVSQLAKKNETVAVALFSTYSRNIAVRIG
jgi:hypothetical protein